MRSIEAPKLISTTTALGLLALSTLLGSSCLSVSKNFDNGSSGLLCDGGSIEDRARALVEKNNKELGKPEDDPFSLGCAIANIEALERNIAGYCRAVGGKYEEVRWVILSAGYTLIWSGCIDDAMDRALTIDPDRPLDERRTAFKPVQEYLCLDQERTARDWVIGYAEWLAESGRITADSQMCLVEAQSTLVRDYGRACDEKWASLEDGTGWLVRGLESCGIERESPSSVMLSLAKQPPIRH